MNVGIGLLLLVNVPSFRQILSETSTYLNNLDFTGSVGIVENRGLCQMILVSVVCCIETNIARTS